MLRLTDMLDKLAQDPPRARRHRRIDRRAARGLRELRRLVHQCPPVPFQRHLEHRLQPHPVLPCGH
jgi:hypothetical protein